MAKYTTKRSLGAKIAWGLTVLGIAGAAVGGVSYARNEALDYMDENKIFDVEKVDSQLDYWGGDDRYVDNSYNKFTFKSNSIYDHFNVGDRPVKVAYAANISESERQNYNHVFEYLNEIFEVINPKYKFEIVDTYQSNSDIFISNEPVSSTSGGPEIGAYVRPQAHFLHSSKVTRADIVMNSNVEACDTYKRYMLLHEMMHVLFGSLDVNENESQTFSVYNSGDVGFLYKKVESAKVAEKLGEEEYKGDCAFQTIAEKNSYVAFLPTDLSTVIALYGDMSVPGNVENYKVLLQEHLQQSYKLFGDNQPYYENGFEIPTPSVNVELENDDKGQSKE